MKNIELRGLIMIESNVFSQRKSVTKQIFIIVLSEDSSLRSAQRQFFSDSSIIAFDNIQQTVEYLVFKN